MSPVAIDVESHGLDEQIAKLQRFDAIATPFIRQADQQGIALIAGGWRAVVPVLSGEYQGSIVGEVQSVVGLTSKAVASTDVLAADRYPYPFMLEKSDRFPKTKGKAAASLRSKKSAIVALFEAAADRIMAALAVR